MSCRHIIPPSPPLGLENLSKACQSSTLISSVQTITDYLSVQEEHLMYFWKIANKRLCTKISYQIIYCQIPQCRDKSSTAISGSPDMETKVKVSLRNKHWNENNINIINKAEVGNIHNINTWWISSFCGVHFHFELLKLSCKSQILT